VLDVFVDDEPIRTGTANTIVGDTARTWYEGVSYSIVNPFRITDVTRNPLGTVTLTWNSIPPPFALTIPTYTLLRSPSLSNPAWTTVATRIPSEGSSTSYTDDIPTGTAAFYRITAP
jgi:hypothetical protein